MPSSGATGVAVGGHNGFSRGKTIFVLAVVVGCFAVLWPRIFYPMFTASLIGDSGDEVCCDVMSEKDTNAYHLMTEICGNILRRDSKLPPPLDSGQPGKKIEISKPAANLCRNEILKQCGVDVLLLLKENAAMTKEYKKSLNQIRSFNTSHCLKISYGVDVVEEIGLARMTKGPFSSPSHMRPERHLRPELMHPALREKGQAIPSPRVPRRTIDREARPGPVPGMRPPMAQAAHVPNTPKGSGTMGIVMPMYTFGIICFFVYTLMKLVSWYFMVNVTCDYVYSCLCILFKKPADEISPPVKPQPILKDLIDPDHRKYGAYSSSEDAYPNGSERSKKVVDDYKQKEDANRRKASAGAAAGKSDTFKGRLERETVSQEEDYSKDDDGDDEKSEIHNTDSWSPNETTTSSSYEPSSSSMEQDTMILAATKKAVPPTLTVQPPTPSTPPVASEIFVEPQKIPEVATIIEHDDNKTTTTTTPGDDKTDFFVDNPPQNPSDERLTPEQLTSAALFFDETIEISDADFEHVSCPTGKLDASRHDGQQEDKIDDELSPVISATPPSPQLVEYAGSLANRILADATSTVTANDSNQNQLTGVEQVVDTSCVTNQEITNQNNQDVPLTDLPVEPDKSNITISTNLIKEEKPVTKKITPEIWKSSISQEVLEYAEALAKRILNEAKTTILSSTPKLEPPLDQPPIPPKRTKRKKVGSLETKNSASSMSSNDSPLSTPLITLIDEGRKNSEPILANQKKSGLEISPVEEGSVVASGTVVDTLGGYVTLVDDEATNSMSRQKKAFLKNLGSGVEITAVEELEKPAGDRSMDSNDSVITVKESEIMVEKVEGGESRGKEQVEKVVVKDKTLASAEVPLTPQNSIESAILDHVGIVTPPSQKPLQDSVNLTEMLLGTQSAQLSPDSNTSILLISNETNKPVDEIAPTAFPHDSLQDQKIEVLEKVDQPDQKIEILEKADLPDQKIEILEKADLPDQKIEILEKVDLPDQKIEILEKVDLPDQKIEISEKVDLPDQKTEILEKADDTNILDSERDHIASIIDQVIDQAEQVIQSRPPELMAILTSNTTSEEKQEENLTSPNLVEVFNSEQQDQTIISENIAASASPQITDLLESNSTPHNPQTLLENEPDSSLDFELVEPDDAEIAAMYSFLQSVKSSPPRDSKSEIEFIPEVHPLSVPPITLESCTNPLKSSTLLATKTEPLVEQQSETGPDDFPPLISDKATESTLVTTSLKNELTPSQSVLTTTTTTKPDSNRSAKPNEITGDASSPAQVVTQDVLLTKPGVSDNNVSIPAAGESSRKEDVCSQESHPVVKAVQGILDQVSALGQQASKIETDELTKISQKNEESRSSSKPEKEVDLEQPKGSIKEENKKSEEKAKLEPERKSSVKRHPSAEKEVTFQLPEAKKPEVEDDEEEEEVEEEEEEEEEPVRPPTPPRHGGSKKSKHSAAAAIALAKQASSPQSQQHREILSVLGIEETAEMESGEKWDDRTPTPTFRMATPPVPHRAPSPPEDIPSIFLEGPLPMAGQQLMVSDSQVEMEGGDYGDDYENNTAPIILSGKVTLSVISGGGGAPDEITDASSLSYDDKGKNKNKTAIKAEKGLSNARKTPASTSHKEYEDIKKGFKNDEDSDDVDLTTYLTAEADNDGQNNKEDTEGDISVMGKIEELPKDEE